MNEPLFDIAWWSGYERTRDQIEKASCRQESWHKVFSTDVRKHPSVIQLINLILLEQNLVEICIAQLKSGDDFQIRKMQLEHMLKLQRLVRSFDEENL